MKSILWPPLRATRRCGRQLGIIGSNGRTSHAFDHISRDKVTSSCPRPKTCYSNLSGLQNNRHAHSHSISGRFVYCRTARSRRAMGFSVCAGGGMRLSTGGLHVSLPSSRLRAQPKLQHGQWWPVRIGLSRQLPEFASQRLVLCAHRTPLVESHRAIKLGSRHLNFKLVAVPRANP